MKRFASLITAVSILFPVAASAAPYNNVLFYDALRASFRGVTLTDSVLDGSIDAEIDRVHPTEIPIWEELNEAQQEARWAKIEYNRKRNKVALSAHCRQAVRVTKQAPEGNCGMEKSGAVQAVESLQVLQD